MIKRFSAECVNSFDGRFQRENITRNKIVYSKQYIVVLLIFFFYSVEGGDIPFPLDNENSIFFNVYYNNLILQLYSEKAFSFNFLPLTPNRLVNHLMGRLPISTTASPLRQRTLYAIYNDLQFYGIPLNIDTEFVSSIVNQIDRLVQIRSYIHLSRLRCNEHPLIMMIGLIIIEQRRFFLSRHCHCILLYYEKRFEYNDISRYKNLISVSL